MMNIPPQAYAFIVFMAIIVMLDRLQDKRGEK